MGPKRPLHLEICEKRDVVNLINQASPSQSTWNEAKKKDSDGPCGSFKLDNDDESLQFSQELRNFHIPNYFVLPKILK